MAEIEARNRRVRLLYRQVDRFIAPSRFLLEEYVGHGIERSKSEYLDYGFDLALWRATSSGGETSSVGAKLRAAYLGTSIPSEGVHVLLEAFRA